MNYTLPPEWYVQDGIQLTWPDATTDWAPYIGQITDTYLQLAKVITKHEQLIVATANAKETRAIIARHLDYDQIGRVDIYQCGINDTWARDHAAITMVATDDARLCKLLDFKFNGWGEKFAWGKDNAITKSLFCQGAFNGSLESHEDFVLEGGAVESDGHGTIFTTTHCLMAKYRNQPLTQRGIEEKLKDVFNAKRIVWLNHGTLIGDDTDGHIDTIVRVCPDDTLLYVGCDDNDDEQYEDFLLLEKELEALTTIDGKPYSLMRLPMPDAIYDDGERLPATYANFVILNGAVIVPAYNQPDSDRMAASIIGKAFPDREIISIDASTVVRQHGSLHCITMQYPKYSLKHTFR